MCRRIRPRPQAASSAIGAIENILNFGLREVIVSVIVFAMFFSTPTLSKHLRRKHKIKILGEELVPIILPLIAGVGFYQQDWSMSIFGLIASAGYFFGLWYVHKKMQSPG